MQSDDFAGLRQAFLLGHFGRVSREATALSDVAPEERIALRVFCIRAQLAQAATTEQYQMVFASVANDAPPALQCLKMLALARARNDPAMHSQMLAQLQNIVESQEESEQFLLCAALTLRELGDLKTSLRLLSKCKSASALALRTQFLLQLRRVDLAKAILKELQKIDEDDAATVLASVWIATMTESEQNLEEALSNLRLLLESYGPSSTLLQLLACVHMRLAKYQDAVRYLKDACELRQEEGLPIVTNEAASNAFVCLRHAPDNASELPPALLEAAKTSEAARVHAAALDRFDAAAVRVN
ncbi:MAG: hypothetical protein MHM6MM_005912 [Cercozoa sp. M6MM]